MALASATLRRLRFRPALPPRRGARSGRGAEPSRAQPVSRVLLPPPCQVSQATVQCRRSGGARALGRRTRPEPSHTPPWTKSHPRVTSVSTSPFVVRGQTRHWLSLLANVLGPRRRRLSLLGLEKSPVGMKRLTRRPQALETFPSTSRGANGLGKHSGQRTCSSTRFRRSVAPSWDVFQTHLSREC